jgi:hypothetical protein
MERLVDPGMVFPPDWAFALTAIANPVPAKIHSIGPSPKTDALVRQDSAKSSIAVKATGIGYSFKMV